MKRKKIGWFCSYTPLELIDAAGCEPYGVRKDSGHGHEDVYLGDSICSYVRSCLGGALAGTYDFLDGVVITHSCECMRRLYDGWEFKSEDIGPRTLHFLDVPRVCNEKSVLFFVRGLERFRAELERRYGPISDESIHKSIKKYNRTRDLFSRIQEMRKDDAPHVSGADVAGLVTRGMTIPRDAFNSVLEGFVQASAGAERNPGPRIMIYGGPLNCSLAGIVEGAGGVVVYENMCNGLRQMDVPVEPEEEPLLALSRGYLGKIPCSRMLGPHGDQGLEQMKNLAREYRVDGVIFHSIKFCANMQFHAAIVKNELDIGVPVKAIEGEISSEINEREIHSFVKNLGRRSPAMQR